jgi:hypothetical protein
MKKQHSEEMKKTRCAVHDVIEIDADERPVYPYRCSRCGGCFVCEHQLVGRTHWICRDGFRKPATRDPGVFV